MNTRQRKVQKPKALVENRVGKQPLCAMYVILKALAMPNFMNKTMNRKLVSS